MKTKITVLVLFLCTSLSAQKHAFKVSPVGFFNNGFGASYENYIGNSDAIEVSIVSGSLDKVQNSAIDLVGGEIKYKKYFHNKATFKGLYAAGFANITSAGSENGVGNLLIIAPGALCGYQFMLGKKTWTSGFIFDINAGFGYNFINRTTNENLNRIKGFQPRLGIVIGYAF